MMMRNILKVLLLGCILNISSLVSAENNTLNKASIFNKLNKKKAVYIGEDSIMVAPRWFIPDYLKMQYAGNIGFASIGLGYVVKSRYESALLIGLVNETFGDSKKSITTVSLKNSFKLLRKPFLNFIIPKAGIAINWGHTNNTFRKLPAHYANKYYFQNKVHAAPFWGAEFCFKTNTKFIKGYGFYFEMATLDAYLLEYIRTDYVKLNDIWNLAVGISFYIH